MWNKKLIFGFIFLIQLSVCCGQDYIDLYDDILYNRILGVKAPEAKRELINTVVFSSFSDFIKYQNKYLNKAYVDTIRVNGEVKIVKKFDADGLCIDSFVFKADSLILREKVFYADQENTFWEKNKQLSTSVFNYKVVYTLLTNKKNERITISYWPNSYGYPVHRKEIFYNKNETRIDSIWGSRGSPRFFYSKKNRLKKVFINSGEHIIYTKYNKKQLTEIVLYEIKPMEDYSPEFYYPAKRISDFFPIRYEIDDLIPTSFIKELLNQNFKKKNQIPFLSMIREKRRKQLLKSEKISDLAYCFKVDGDKLVGLENYENNSIWKKIMYDASCSGTFLYTNKLHLINFYGKDSLLYLVFFEPIKRTKVKYEKDTIIVTSVIQLQYENMIGNEYLIEKFDANSGQIFEGVSNRTNHSQVITSYLYNKNNQLETILENRNSRSEFDRVVTFKSYADSLGKTLWYFLNYDLSINGRTCNLVKLGYDKNANLEREEYFDIPRPKKGFKEDSLLLYPKVKVGEVGYKYFDKAKKNISEVNFYYFKPLSNNPEIFTKINISKNTKKFTLTLYNKKGIPYETTEHSLAIFD